jgi:Na+/H+-translocating membrane pyrophosphatase
MGVFGLIIFICVDMFGSDWTFCLYTTMAFLVGGFTSMACGYMGMHVATHTNTKVSFIAQSSLDEAYKLAYRAGCVIGFSLTGISLLMLIILIAIYT